MLPEFKKVLQKKRLVIWGSLNKEALEVLLAELPYDGLYLHIIAPTVKDAKYLVEYTKSNKKNYHGIFKH